MNLFFIVFKTIKSFLSKELDNNNKQKYNKKKNTPVKTTFIVLFFITSLNMITIMVGINEIKNILIIFDFKGINPV